MDPITIGLIAGAGMGTVRAINNKKRQKEQDAFRKTAIAMSPWTDLGDPGPVNAGPQGLESVLGGTAQGGSIAALGKSGGLWGSQVAPAPVPGMSPADLPKGTPIGSWGAMGEGGSAGAMGVQNPNLLQSMKKMNPYSPNAIFGVDPNQVAG